MQLFGAVEALLESTQTQLRPFDYDQYQSNVAAVRAQLDDATFAKAWAEGRAMTMEQAIAEAQRVTESKQTDSLAQTQTPTQPPTPTYPAGLTAREVEVLRLLAQGLTDAQIAETLVISPRTVNSHLRSIYSKLDVTTRTAAARIAMEYKLV